jgi:hypothetical protein
VGVGRGPIGKTSALYVTALRRSRGSATPPQEKPRIHSALFHLACKGSQHRVGRAHRENRAKNSGRFPGQNCGCRLLSFVLEIFCKRSGQAGGASPALRRVKGREFLRNIFETPHSRGLGGRLRRDGFWAGGREMEADEPFAGDTMTADIW